jgi:cyclase
MSLKVRVIATVLWNGQAVVKGRGFAADRVIGTPRQVLRVFAARDIDELVFLDVRRGAPPDPELIEDLAADASFPLAVGGGIWSVEDARIMIAAGADKVVLGSRPALARPELVGQLAERFGSQAVVVSIDCEARYGGEVLIAGGYEREGAGEILLQSVPRDGTLGGYDTEIIHCVANAVSIPVIASGGCSGPADMLAAVRAGASAVAAGALFSFTDTTPATCRVYLSEHGVAVRA